MHEQRFFETQLQQLSFLDAILTLALVTVGSAATTTSNLPNTLHRLFYLASDRGDGCSEFAPKSSLKIQANTLDRSQEPPMLLRQ